ncbi:MAG: amino acid decarboxylase, partial [Saprospiraceae bacterium]
MALEFPSLDWHQILAQEQSLDPDNWDAVSDLGKKMVEEMVDYLQHIDQEPIWRKPPEEVKNLVKEKWSDQGKELQHIYQDFKQYILPYPKGNIHPRFWSWVQGTGSITAALADFLASTLNSNLAIGDHSAMY